MTEQTKKPFLSGQELNSLFKRLISNKVRPDVAQKLTYLAQRYKINPDKLSKTILEYASKLPTKYTLPAHDKKKVPGGSEYEGYLKVLKKERLIPPKAALSSISPFGGPTTEWVKKYDKGEFLSSEFRIPQTEEIERQELTIERLDPNRLDLTTLEGAQRALHDIEGDMKNRIENALKRKVSATNITGLLNEVEGVIKVETDRVTQLEGAINVLKNQGIPTKIQQKRLDAEKQNLDELKGAVFSITRFAKQRKLEADMVGKLLRQRMQELLKEQGEHP